CSKVLKCVCPLLYSRPDEYRILKLFAGFFYGIILGLALYELILVDLSFTPLTCYVLGGSLCLIISIGTAVSMQARCISLLAVFSFCGKAGQGVLKGIILAYVIAGPITNIIMNTQQVVHVFSCTASLTYNLTKTRFDLMFRPFAEAVLNMKADVNEFKDMGKSVKGMLVPIVEEIEGEEEMRRIREDNEYIDELQGDSSREKEIREKYKEEDKEPESSRFEKRYMRKMAERCEDIVSRSAGKCRRMFAETYDKCYDKVSWVAAWILCWPMKLTFVCNIVEAIGGNKACDVSKVMEPGFGEGYEYLKLSRTTLTEQFKAAKLQYKIPHMPQLINVREAIDTTKGIVNDFERRRLVLVTILLVMTRLLSFLFIRIVLSAQQYHDAYVSDIQFDNVYITRYFRRIDARRHKRGQHTLLPLKKVERQDFIDPYKICLAKRERTKLSQNMSQKIILEMVTATIFIILDRILFEGLDLVRRHASIEYTQEGSHDLILKVKGTGMIATLVRSVLGGFNIRKRANRSLDSGSCLPQPTKLETYYICKIYGMYFGVWLLMLSQGYTQRYRRLICAYFYPKREKRRVLFLYNETLKKRRGLLRFMRAKVKQRAKESRLEMDANILVVMQVKYPRMCSWLKVFASARRKCLICKELEPKKGGQFLECPNPDCYFVYCAECWRDVKHICYACSSADSDETDLELL
ncbi:hypothetical protein L9F63_020139, partial [Diploptera punctata]